MIENLKNIKIKGRCFKNETNFNLFPISTSNSVSRISIIYGKNGSGKSTISDGISNISSGLDSDNISAKFIDSSGNDLSIDNDEKIYVFNEKYIDQNVKINEEGLSTIILLGEQVDIQSEIDRYTILEQETKEKVERLQVSYENISDEKNVLSPGYYLSKIKKVLQSNWAIIDAEIRGNKTKTRITDSLISEIEELKFKTSKVQLEDDFKSKKNILDIVSNSTIKDILPIQTVEISDDFEKIICNLLSKVIEKPVLSERENLILKTIQKGRQSLVEQAKSDFSSDDANICPYCYRSIDEKYKNELIENINRILNKDVEEHRTELKLIVFPNFKQEYENLKILDECLVNDIINKQEECDKLTNSYRQYLQQKENNLFTPININSLGMIEQIHLLNSMLMQLEDKRIKFVDAINHKKELTEELIILNKKIAYKSIEQLAKEHKQKTIDLGKAFIDLTVAKEEYNQISLKLNQMKQKKADVTIAVDTINNALDYVFFEKGRLSIELRNDKYYLKSNGNDVIPKNVSLGERNAIALCYFFVQIHSNENVSELYQNKELVVIDDPVSSFDFENKVGIISLLRYQINRIVKGNKDSKVLVFSHDLTTIFDLRKAAKEVCNTTVPYNNKKTTYYVGELFVDTINIINEKKARSEYVNLLETIYRYANGDSQDDDHTIGNSMRRALEAFSTFSYRKGIEDVLIEDNILKELGDNSKYFENLMWRLVLHGESHLEEQVYSFHDGINFYQFISDAEKQRTARDILCFMYLMNKCHIKAYFKNENGAIEQIKTWIQNIPKNSSFEV